MDTAEAGICFPWVLFFERFWNTSGIASANTRPQRARVIASIAFRDFKALRNTHVVLSPFNLVIGPNGSGKTSLIEALSRLRALSRLPLSDATAGTRKAGGAEIEFTFAAPHDNIVARMGCVSDDVCDVLRIEPPDAGGWLQLRDALGTIRSYVLDHQAMSAAAKRGEGAELKADGGNLAAVLANIRERAPDAFSALTEELLRIAPEFGSLELVEHADDSVEFAMRLAENGVVRSDELSQGTLYVLGILALAFDPDPPHVLCIEEIDRGIHPRTLREIRDALYRLSYPKSHGSDRRAVQIITTSHSPYFIDLFREHPEEIVISHKHGRAAQFSRLSDRADLPELLREGSLGDMWYSGILGGVPEER
ncbi:MAG: AAA family ATPase [Opitutaceae bacterium]